MEFFKRLSFFRSQNNKALPIEGPVNRPRDDLDDSYIKDPRTLNTTVGQGKLKLIASLCSPHNIDISLTTFLYCLISRRFGKFVFCGTDCSASNASQTSISYK